MPAHKHERKILMYDKFGISNELIELSKKVEDKIKDIFILIDEIAEYNQGKVLYSMQKNQLSERHFNPTTGYGYNDDGREIIEKIYAEVFGVEDALVRSNFVNGTHALNVALWSVLRPGDKLLAITGKPYDTLDEAIGANGQLGGSLTEFGVKYEEIELNENYDIDVEKVVEKIKSEKIKVAMLQRSKGYSVRKTLSSEEINNVIRKIKEIDSEVICMVDNCYGEFVEREEPYMADILVGSLIKNPGGGLAPTGAYIAGKTKYVELAANRLTSPGIGKECGATLGINRSILQGFFMAPHIVAQAVKTAVFCAGMMEELGYEVIPKSNEIRRDIIQLVKLGDKDKLIAFCRGLQAGSPIDSYVVPTPWAMPGYNDEVIMAAGAFIQGSSIEISADAPIREPYVVYMQGGLTYESGKIAILKAVADLA